MSVLCIGILFCCFNLLWIFMVNMYSILIMYFLFDFDGIFMDSDVLYYVVFNIILLCWGCLVDVDYYKIYIMGVFNVMIFDYLFFGMLVLEYQLLVEEKEQLFCLQLDQQVVFMFGIECLFDYIVCIGGCMVVVINVLCVNVELMLKVIGLVGCFDMLVIGDELECVKFDFLFYLIVL